MAILGTAKQSVCTIGDVQCDAEIRTAHGKAGTLTEHPVESGAPVTDHYRVDPDEVEIEGLVSDSPLSDVPFPGFGTVTSIASALEGGDQTPSQIARDALIAYFDDAEIITITTRLRTYDQMVLTSLRYDDTAQNGNVLRFTVRARKIRLTDTATGQAITIPKTPTHAKKQSAGKAGTNTAGDAAAGKPQSILAGLFGVGG